MPNKLHDSLKLLNHRPALYILIQKTVIILYMPYNLKVFGRIIDKKCLVNEPVRV